jgi:hypothetical protein
MTEQIQSLDFQLIERASDKFSNIREIIIHMEVDGKIQQFVVEIYTHFSSSSMTMCIQELIEKLDIVRTYDKDGVGKMMTPYMIFLAIKHFTTLNLPNVFAQQLKAIEHMTNTGVMFQIFAAFDEVELDKLKDQVSLIVDSFNKNLPEIDKIKKQLELQLVDKSLLE